MAKYKFPNHQAELIDPNVDKVTTNFSIGDEYVSVSAVLNANGNKLYGVFIGMMPNTVNWTDSDLTAFVNTQLQNFIVQS